MNRIVINASAADARISRHIYGHFSEHLGRCIYGGFWAGRSSPIPNGLRCEPYICGNVGTVTIIPGGL